MNNGMAMECSNLEIQSSVQEAAKKGALRFCNNILLKTTLFQMKKAAFCKIWRGNIG